MGSRREQAVKAEADRLAKDLFDAAQAKQAEADGLASRQNFAAATPAYQDAAERYMEAAGRAQMAHEAKTQADTAKARMLAEKQRAYQAAPEFSVAAAEEKQANASYERLAYKEAAEKFRSAEMLFARAVAKPAPGPPPRGEPPAPTPAPSPPPRPRPTPSPF